MLHHRGRDEYTRRTCFEAFSCWNRTKGDGAAGTDRVEETFEKRDESRLDRQKGERRSAKTIRRIQLTNRMGSTLVLRMAALGREVVCCVLIQPCPAADSPHNVRRTMQIRFGERKAVGSDGGKRDLVLLLF